LRGTLRADKVRQGGIAGLSFDEPQLGSRGKGPQSACQVPCDYIGRRSYPLFQAREVLRLLAGEATEGSEECAFARKKNPPTAGFHIADKTKITRLVPVDNSLIFINFMNRLRAKRTDSLTNRFFLLSIRPV